MTPQDRRKRRAQIIRRWTAHRVSIAQREIWKERRVRAGRSAEDDDDTGSDGLLAEMPDSLLG